MPNTPKSDEALSHFDEFCSGLRLRLENGREVYGDSSFGKPHSRLVEEIRQEILDIVGWAFILYSRLPELEAKVEQVQSVNFTPKVLPEES